jgi:gamma-glutamyltranspeptidase
MDETTGQVLKLGDTFKFPALAETLKQVASVGVGAFYDGAIGDMLIDDVQQRGGLLTKEDLGQYR